MHFLQVWLLAVASSIVPTVSGAIGQSKPVERQISSQSLVDALSKYPALSSFQQLLKDSPGIINVNAKNVATVLVPDNEALSAFVKLNNATSISQLSTERLRSIFQYHTLAAALNTTDFSASRGLTVPTKLVDTLYNLRSPGPALIKQFGEEANGQVLYISKDTLNSPKFRVRQTGSTGDKASLRAGLGQTAELTGVDGVWDGGYFQVINTVLEPPRICSTTIRKLSSSLSSLDDALKKVKLWQELDKKPNITCLGPSTEAFAAAGNPERNLNSDQLKNALLLHTLPQVTYSNYLTDGQEFVSLSNITVKVTVQGDQIWFNDAKVINPNVLTNNGLIHILDRVMSANGKPDLSVSPSSSPTTPSGTASPSSTGTPPNSAGTFSEDLRVAGAIAFAAVMLLI
ncbi:beta-ig-h3 fasciclin [Colletotrichum truncatum]|uniref:Beta-ig-h3 fasciclin n=1 Tax=Colletotrichum truncatum TaxID=5467 RepID=A0ACC3ZEB3_COLTU|nr:beta-ig-h3 fasciclin [Colletotrichum truncatum]KAF6801373.1 beta-ig-h3 fasciclin [Colletotrichum truncatum]